MVAGLDANAINSSPLIYWFGESDQQHSTEEFYDALGDRGRRAEGSGGLRGATEGAVIGMHVSAAIEAVLRWLNHPNVWPDDEMPLDEPADDGLLVCWVEQ